MTPKILYQNENFIAVEKPAGMIVNRADTAKGAVTLQDFIEENFNITSALSNDKERYMVDGYNKQDEFISRSGIVHRLDKETSGIILVALNVESFIELQNQFKDGTVSKTYITLVHGKVEERTGSINEPIGRLPWNRTRFGILPEGREAKTDYKVISFFENAGREKEILTLVEVYPKSGRTHQIRVHFQHIKHPVFADELYAGRKTGRDDRKKLSRHFLHAARIKLKNPKTKEEMEISSELPIELDTFLKTLKQVS